MYRKRRRVRVYHKMDNSADQKNMEKEKTMINAMMGQTESECGKLERTLWNTRLVWAWWAVLEFCAKMAVS